jgi:FtsP/CotA-like multicopper oxidase with cupredoxin domain
MKMTGFLALALAMALIAPAFAQFTQFGLPPPPMAAMKNATDGAPMVNLNWPKKMSDPPMSPYINTTYACPKGLKSNNYAVDRIVMSQNDFIPHFGSPFSWDHLVFQTPYKLPPFADKLYSSCEGNPENMLCSDAYIINVQFAMIDLGCPLGPTPMVTYNGSYPGPTFLPPAGRQTVIRVTNKLYVGEIPTIDGTPVFEPLHPCNGDTNTGLPSSFHHHGGSSLAPYDGWADDITCPGQSKDYIFADQDPAFLWYHDHTIAFTTFMVYHGMAGLWIVDDSLTNGGCGYPWGIEGIPTLYFALGDRTFKSDCTNYFNMQDAFILGDVNAVSGIAWPAVEAAAQWTKILLLAATNERVWLVRIVDEFGVDQSSKLCKVIGSDAGLGRMPMNYPPTGVWMSPGERYELMCNFEGMEGQILYVWNEYDHFRMDNQCFFCYTHLIAKLTLTAAAPNPPKFMFDGPRSTLLDRTLPKNVIKAAQQMKMDGECTRVFNFSHDPTTFVWFINGETWDSFRVGAPDVGQNTWELWCLNTEIHIQHPVHLHVVSGYIVSRNNSMKLLEPYEIYMPKDVFVMYPNFETSIVVRFGPNLGEWMFHCHITKHEDEVMMRSMIFGENDASSLAEESAFGSQKALSRVNKDMIAQGLNDPDGKRPKNIADMLPLIDGYYSKIAERPYRIYYPNTMKGDSPKLRTSANPWFFSCDLMGEVMPMSNMNIKQAMMGYMYAATHSTWGTNCLDSEWEDIEPGSSCETPVDLGCPMGWNNDFPCNQD